MAQANCALRATTTTTTTITRAPTTTAVLAWVCSPHAIFGEIPHTVRVYLVSVV